MTDPKDAQGPDREAGELIHARVRPRDAVPIEAGPPVPFTAEELRDALRLRESPELADEVAAELSRGGLDRPGTFWSGDIFMLVALLSPAHEERIREYLGLTPERMAEELAKARATLRDR